MWAPAPCVWVGVVEGNHEDCPYGVAVAEGVGFEPTMRFNAYLFSRQAPSSARPSLQWWGFIVGEMRGWGEGGAGGEKDPFDKIGVIAYYSSPL